MSVTDAASHLGIERSTLSRLLNGHSGISAEMAIRLEKAGWSNADMWLRLQAAYDLSEARKNEDKIHVERFEASGRRSADLTHLQGVRTVVHFPRITRAPAKQL